MKRLTTLLFAIMSVVALSAQQPYKVYCTISGLHNNATFGTISRIDIDYGQENCAKNYLVDERGKAINGLSVTAVANLMSKCGWELEDSYVVGDDQVRCVWIMSKIVTDESEITEGFKTRWMVENGY